MNPSYKRHMFNVFSLNRFFFSVVKPKRCYVYKILIMYKKYLKCDIYGLLYNWHKINYFFLKMEKFTFYPVLYTRSGDIFFYNSKLFFKYLFTFLNKLMSKGKSYIINNFFFDLMWCNRSITFFSFFIESIFALEPLINLKILKYKKKGKRSVKKGKKVPPKVKAIPERIKDKSKGITTALKWLVNSILSSNLSIKSAVISELRLVFFRDPELCMSIKQKKSFYRLAFLNKSSAHFRWRKRLV